jgi:dihydroxy-acid dehydratase
VVGHITPEAFEGGMLAFIHDDDVIEIDAANNTINVKIESAILEERKKNWSKPPLSVTKGILYKYAKQVTTAAEGCITDK